MIAKLKELSKDKNGKVALGLGLLATVLVTLMVVSGTTVTRQDLELASVICDAHGGFHSMKTTPMGAKAVSCAKRLEREFICLDKVVDQKDLRLVDSVYRCTFSNDASDDEIAKALESTKVKNGAKAETKK